MIELPSFLLVCVRLSCDVRTMSVILYPRLDNLTALQLHRDMEGKTLVELLEMSSIEHRDAIYTQTGGVNIDDASLQNIAEEIRSLAKECGYPDKKDQKMQARFDARAAAWLYSNMDISFGEVVRKDVWSFITLVMLPDVSKWRFPGFNTERLLGGVRNVFQRLWYRAYMFDLGGKEETRWKLLEALTEDAMVAIIERPSISANRELAKNIGLSWIRTSNLVGREKMEAVNRTAMKYLRQTIPLICLDALSESNIKYYIDDCYKRAVEVEG